MSRPLQKCAPVKLHCFPENHEQNRSQPFYATLDDMDVHIQSRNRQLEGKIFTGKYRGRAILLIHGWRSDQTRLDTVCAEQIVSMLDYTCLTFNLSGHDKSCGDIKTLSRSDFLQDACAAYDYLNKVTKESVITAGGSSLGAYLALLLSTKRPVENLALRVPANYPDAGFYEPQQNFSAVPETYQWRLKKQSADTTRSLRTIHAFAGNVLIVESEHDELLPHQTVANYIQAAPRQDKLTHILMKDIGHGLGRYPERQTEYAHILTEWLAETWER
jgi:esterase/lipase